MIQQNASVKPRHEWKHTINPGDDAVLTARLRRLFPHDSHAGPDGSYRVTSLYFDNPYDRALRQKLDGVDAREKFRLRYYNGDPSFLRLEKKSKRKGLCFKESARLSAEEVRQILAGDYDFLLDRRHPLLTEFYSKLRGQLLRPKTIVSYDREAFLFAPGNVRITIDRDLHTGLTSTDFLDPGIPLLPVSEGLPVLEVKYDEFLPELVRMAVQVPNRRSAAYSKYAVCRRYD